MEYKIDMSDFVSVGPRCYAEYSCRIVSAIFGNNKYEYSLERSKGEKRFIVNNKVIGIETEARYFLNIPYYEEVVNEILPYGVERRYAEITTFLSDAAEKEMNIALGALEMIFKQFNEMIGSMSKMYFYSIASYVENRVKHEIGEMSSPYNNLIKYVIQEWFGLDKTVYLNHLTSVEKLASFEVEKRIREMTGHTSYKRWWNEEGRFLNQ